MLKEKQLSYKFGMHFKAEKNLPNIFGPLVKKKELYTIHEKGWILS